MLGALRKVWVDLVETAFTRGLHHPIVTYFVLEITTSKSLAASRTR
jgi:hypothetical protein